MASPNEFRNIIGIAYAKRDLVEEARRQAPQKYASIWTSMFVSIANLYLRTSEYCHCEIAFMYESQYKRHKCLAFSVFAESGVFEKEREFSKDHYRWVFLQVSETQKARALAFCRANVKKPFDQTGAYFMPFWAGPEPSGESWWCGSFTLAALHRAGFLLGMRNGSIDIDDIVLQLLEHRRRTFALDPQAEQQRTRFLKKFKEKKPQGIQ